MLQTEKVWDAGKKTTTGIELEQAGKKERDLYFYNDRWRPACPGRGGSEPRRHRQGAAAGGIAAAPAGRVHLGGGQQ